MLDKVDATADEAEWRDYVWWLRRGDALGSVIRFDKPECDMTLLSFNEGIVVADSRIELALLKVPPEPSLDAPWTDDTVNKGCRDANA